MNKNTKRLSQILKISRRKKLNYRDLLTKKVYPSTKEQTNHKEIYSYKKSVMQIYIKESMRMPLSTYYQGISAMLDILNRTRSKFIDPKFTFKSLFLAAPSSRFVTSKGILNRMGKGKGNIIDKEIFLPANSLICVIAADIPKTQYDAFYMDINNLILSIILLTSKSNLLDCKLHFK